MFGRALKTAPVSILVLATAGIMLKVRPEMASANSPPIPRVRAISIHNSSGGAVIIDVTTTRPVPYRTLKLSSPERLVVDLRGADKAGLKGIYPAQSQILKRVRVGQWKSNPPIVRVVADLNGTPAYSVHALASVIRIKLKPHPKGDKSSQRAHLYHSKSEWNIADKTKILVGKSAAKSPFTVHQFQDLAASLTAPDIPSQDRLVPVTRPDPSPSSPKAKSTLALVSGISIKPGSNGRTYVDIASTRSVPYRVFQLAHPFRLVIDLKDARDASRKEVYPTDSSVLKRIRIGQWRAGNPSVVRVVADLKGYPIFDVFARRPGIRIDLRPRLQLSPLIRNPFEFATQRRAVHSGRRTTQPNQVTTAGNNLSAPGYSFSDLKVIGYLEEGGSKTEAIIADHANIYFVPEGGTIEKTFRVLSISANAVEIQNVKTLQSNWLSYTR